MTNEACELRLPSPATALTVTCTVPLASAAGVYASVPSGASDGSPPAPKSAAWSSDSENVTPEPWIALAQPSTRCDPESSVTTWSAPAVNDGRGLPGGGVTGGGSGAGGSEEGGTGGAGGAGSAASGRASADAFATGAGSGAGAEASAAPPRSPGAMTAICLPPGVTGATFAAGAACAVEANVDGM